MIYHVSTTIQDCVHERYYSFRKPKWMPIKLFSWLIKKIFIQIPNEQIISDNLFKAVTFGKTSLEKFANQINRWQWEDSLKKKHNADHS